MVALRREGLVVEAVHDEVLVFNPGRSEATALNQSAARVFELCDGTNSVESMKAALEAVGLGPSSDDAVWLALSELADAGLIDIQVPRPSHLGRRELIKQFGVSAAALSALPVVESIRAPSPEIQGSGSGTNDDLNLTPAEPTPSPTAPASATTTTSTTTTTTEPTSAPAVVPTTSTTSTTTQPTSAPGAVPTTSTTSTTTPAPTSPPGATSAPTSAPTPSPTTGMGP